MLLLFFINLADVIIIVVKQGEGSFAAFYQTAIINQLIGLGGQAPYFSGNRGSYVLLGYRKLSGDAVPWVAQDLKAEGLGASKISKMVYLKCKILKILIKIFLKLFLLLFLFLLKFFIPATLNELINIANRTFLAALPQWDEINRLFPLLKVKAEELLTESSTGRFMFSMSFKTSKKNLNKPLSLYN